MKNQTYKNHRRFVPGFHFVTLLLILIFFIGSIVNLVHSEQSNLYSASLICLSGVIFSFLYAYTRIFPIRVQDRAIRAEENLRHMAIAGSLLDQRLTMNQIIALRFAPNEEFVVLAHRAAEENMKPGDIKKAIQQWKADHNRA